jgi:hypothetical protein
MNSNTNPLYYQKGNIEVIDFILDQKMDYLTANVQKYIARWRFKDGIEDLRKARWFLDKLIEQQVNNADTDNKLNRLKSQDLPNDAIKSAIHEMIYRDE